MSVIPLCFDPGNEELAWVLLEKRSHIPHDLLELGLLVAYPMEHLELTLSNFEPDVEKP